MTPPSPVDGLPARVHAAWTGPCGMAPGRAVLVACSGGLDSTVLAAVLTELGVPLALAHAQFGLRGNDSMADEAAVAALAGRLGVAFHRRAFALTGEGSVQMRAREARRGWLEALRREGGFHAVATAHHADDQAETVLMRLLAGSGPEGLAGIRPRQDGFVRPLLGVRKAELRAWAEARGLAWREDRSNDAPVYLRNRLRHEVLPLLEAIRPGSAAVLAGAAERFARARVPYREGLDRALRRLRRSDGTEERVSREALARHPAGPLLLAEWLAPAGFGTDHAAEVFRGLGGQAGARWTAPGGTVYRDRRDLVLRLGAPEEASPGLPVVLPPLPCRANAGGWRFRFQPVDKRHLRPTDGRERALLDSAALAEGALLRPWRAGDYFHPAPSGKKRKLKRFLTDAGVPVAEREAVQVLCVGDRIAWVPGWGVDRRFLALPGRPAVKAERLPE
jgi:tRNA(Ile)-lysidine synthase